MSIIIRLQNLPLCAKSVDIRNFFGGLRIPDGGVHILGGEKGDAFIAFMSDEDARLAIRKDGGKIKDARVKLFLSSHMEMQYEVEKITKNNFGDSQSHKMFGPAQTSEVDVIRCRLSEKKRHSHSRSPHKYNDWSTDKSRPLNEYCQRSRSPVGERIYNSRGSSTSRCRSRSPRRRSRSPKRFLPSQRSPSSKSRTFNQRRKSISPKASNYTRSIHQIELKHTSDDLFHSGWKNSEYCNPEHQSLSQSQLEAELEKRITEQLEKNFAYRKVVGINEFQECNVLTSNIGVRENLSLGVQDSYQQSCPIKNVQHDLMSFVPTATSSDVHQFRDAEFKHGFALDRSQQIIPPFGHSEMFASNGGKGRQKINQSFYITMSRLDPHWNFREAQLILKGIFAPQNHIRFERDNAGYKTGTAFVKLTNKDDFDTVLKKALFTFNGVEITVSECPEFLSHNYFPSNSDFQNETFPQNCDLCYTLKGLPFSCTYDDVVNFFQGFEIADIIIFYGKDGRATGTGFISLTNGKDFEAAISQNGKKILHRYIEMLPCTEKEMSEAKKTHSDAPSFIPYSKLLSEKKLPTTRRPLCALLTGLPLNNTTTKKISSFFSESDLKPDAIHVTLNKKRLSDGRAFVEFTNFLDFDLALKFHGKKLDDNIICVKQVLYDEMIKILDSQKARHHFATSTPIIPALNIPEKVPYLWEPPDAIEEQNKVHADNKNTSHRDHRVGPTYAFETNKQQDSLSHSTFPGKVRENCFPTNEKISINRNSDSHYSKEIFSNTMMNSLFPSMIPNNAQLNPLEKITKNVEDSIKDTTQFIVNNKHISMNTNISESFNSLKKYEENIKISRLSPENEAALLDFLNKDRKFSPGRVGERRSKSPERRGRNSYREKGLDKTKRDYKDEKLYKSRPKGESRSRNERDFRHHNNWRSDSYCRSPLQSDSLHFETDGRQNEGSRECVVHLSNVNISVGTQDLLNFLRGFDFYEDTLIRRYTVEGEPTYDVRVTFFSKREAERAIRILNKCYLQNMPISMFVV